MSYLVLARKWRPQGFDAITGQEHVTKTLKNAIVQNRVHHAFLFCGARGVGKTTAARVMARALNCASVDAPTIDPCGTCSACVEIAAGTSIDVFEIDGASNRGIGEIRELRDGIAYAPQRDRHKIYIIDEVHMLTTEAFNALLKTLEEPPSHVKFIFATTEPHKIPVTILSRCQRFDFKRIPRDIMVGRLEEILTAEGVSIPPEALGLVARESEGSMRDALSLLDRVISFCGKEADFKQVADVLGVADRSWLHTLISSALAHDASGALKVVEDAFQYGLDLRQFTTDLVHYLRDIVVLRVAGADQGLTDLPVEETQKLIALGKDRSVVDLQRLSNIVITTAERLVHANFPRLELEMAVIRMSRLRPLQPLDTLIQRLASIEQSLASGEPLPAPVATEAPKPAPKASPAPAPTQAAPAPGPAPAPAAAPHEAAKTEPSGPPRPTIFSAPTTTQAVATPSAAPAAPDDAPTAPMLIAPEPTAPTIAEVTAPASTGAPFTTDDWERFVDTIRSDNGSLAGYLDQARVAHFSDGVLNITFSGQASSGRAQIVEGQITELLQQHFDGVVALQIDTIEEIDDTPFKRREERAHREREGKRRELETHPLVVDLVARFDGKLLLVRLDEEEQGLT